MLSKHMQKILEESKPLDRDEERKYIELAQEGDIDARHKVIMANIRYVVRMVLKLHNIPAKLEMQDLINEGVEGMCQAIDYYDLSRNYKFITYAHWWIKKNIHNAIYKNLSLIKVPEAGIRTLEKLESAREKIAQEEGINGRAYDSFGIMDLAYDMFADGSAAERNKLKKLMDAQRAFNTGSTCDHTISQNDEKKREQLYAQMDVKKYMNVLNKREQDIVKRYYGIGCRSYTYAEIGDYYVLTAERIRQIHKKAIKKMRRSIDAAPPHSSHSSPSGSDSSPARNGESRNSSISRGNEASSKSSRISSRDSNGPSDGPISPPFQLKGGERHQYIYSPKTTAMNTKATVSE